MAALLVLILAAAGAVSLGLGLLEAEHTSPVDHPSGSEEAAAEGQQGEAEEELNAILESHSWSTAAGTASVTFRDGTLTVKDKLDESYGYALKDAVIEEESEDGGQGMTATLVTAGKEHELTVSVNDLPSGARELTLSSSAFGLDDVLKSYEVVGNFTSSQLPGEVSDLIDHKDDELNARLAEWCAEYTSYDALEWDNMLSCTWTDEGYEVSLNYVDPDGAFVANVSYSSADGSITVSEPIWE